MKSILLIITITLTLSVSMFGQRNPAQTDVDQMCNVSASVFDEDPKGLNVRSEPNAKSKKVGTIPYESEGTSVDIIGYKGNWAKIEQARTSDGVVFSKTGWVYSPLLRVSGKPLVEGGRWVKTYETPNLEHFLVNIQSYSVREFVGCYQDWVKVKIPQSTGAINGWIHSDFLCGDNWQACKD